MWGKTCPYQWQQGNNRNWAEEMFNYRICSKKPSAKKKESSWPEYLHWSRKSEFARMDLTLTKMLRCSHRSETKPLSFTGLLPFLSGWHQQAAALLKTPTVSSLQPPFPKHTGNSSTLYIDVCDEWVMGGVMKSLSLHVRTCEVQKTGKDTHAEGNTHSILERSEVNRGGLASADACWPPSAAFSSNRKENDDLIVHRTSEHPQICTYSSGHFCNLI